MPFGIVFTVIDIVLIVHAIKTGRFYPWFYVLLFLPGIGAAIYVAVELIPEWTGSHEGRKARRKLAATLNPTGRYKQLRDDLGIVDTIANRAALAQECLDIGKFDEAREHFHAILSRPLGDEPAYMLGRARAEFGLERYDECAASLEALKQHWPNYASPEGHLLYARALEGAGRIDEALSNYENVGRYYPGAEPRVRQAQLLARTGKAAESKAIAEDVIRGLSRAPAHVRSNQKSWLVEAKRLVKE